MSKIDDLFKKLRSENRKAFMPFITAGDPDVDFTAAILRQLIAAGADMCEVGIPYSDPVADGPVIQASYTRSLEQGVKLAEILEMLGSVAPTLNAPLVTMVSYAIIYRYGLRDYVATAKSRGITGAIVPDLPLEETTTFAKICAELDFDLIQLVTPTTPRERALKIASTSTGFLYYVSVTGITGERAQMSTDLLENVAWLRQQTALPICIGFGISTVEHVKKLAPVADGLIVGSAIVRQMATTSTTPREAVLKNVGDYVLELVAAMPKG